MGFLGSPGSGSKWRKVGIRIRIILDEDPKHCRREEWGEQLVGKSQPVIVRLGLDTDQPADIKV